MASSVSVTLAFSSEAVTHPLDASGVVFDGGGGAADGLCACIFGATKFPARAPEGTRLVRALFRPAPTELTLARSEWRRRALRALTPVLGLRAPPHRCWVAFWPAVRPRYGPDHLSVVRDLGDQLRGYGSIELAGAAYRPSGVEGAIASGQLAAERVLDHAPSALRTPAS
jgi:protoporphyrinogen oxidase